MPAFTASGRRLRNYSLAAAKGYLERKMCTAEYNRRTGHITSITFRPVAVDSKAIDDRPGARRKHPCLGQHYTFQETVDAAGHHTWTFSEFVVPSELRDEVDSRAAIDAYLREVFLAVPLCLLRR